MKRLLSLVLCVGALVAAVLPADGRRKKAETPPVKYVFYVIGDGMGVNEVIGAEEYNAGTGYGPAEINFFHFPVRGFVTTYSGNSLVTDSAAGGTALASGRKTYNSAISVDMDGKPVSVLTEWAKAAGYGTGVATNVGVNHATPACFIAHTARRQNYEDIATQYIGNPNVDFAAGGGFLVERNSGHDPAFFEAQARAAGISVLHGPAEFTDVASIPGRVLCLSGKSQGDLPYRVDRKEDDTRLSDFVDAGIRYLDAHFGDKGFFFMIEGGKVDYGGHANDAAACFQEVTDLAETMDVILVFCEKHPDESLIVVTADHETGGLMLGAGAYEMHPERMAGQKMSTDALSAKFRRAFFPDPENGRPPRVTADYVPPTWEQVQAFFKENLGLWDTVEVSERAEASLKATYERTFGAHGDRENNVANLYSVNTRIVTEAVSVLNRAAGYSWSYGSHSGSPVGLYAWGKCAEVFGSVRDNTGISVAIAALAGYKR